MFLCAGRELVLTAGDYPDQVVPPIRMPTFLLYSRSYCHLCDDMLAALQPYADETQATITVIDVDADAELLAQYDELVPVLIGVREGVPPRRLCHYFLDHAAVRAFLHD